MMDNTRLIICKASAGSGKTFTLVKQFLTLAFDTQHIDGKDGLTDRFKHILAITFTKKATNEMKSRIIKELNNIAKEGEGSSMCLAISQELHKSPAQLQKDAEILKSAILHNYSDLNVCTIDSFMQRIVKTFAYDLDLPMNFEVEMDQNDMIEQAVDDLLSMAGKQDCAPITAILFDYAKSKMEDGKSYDITKNLQDLSNELFKESAYQHLTRLSADAINQYLLIKKSLKKENEKFKEDVLAVCNNFYNLLNTHGVTEDELYRGKSGIASVFKKANQLTEPNWESSYMLEFVEGDKLAGAKVSPSTKDIIATIKPTIIEYYQQLRILFSEPFKRYNSRIKILDNLYAMALLKQIDEIIHNNSKENAIIHISEFNKKISQEVENEPAPFIYERIGSKYYNYLIDEFQDTSKMQWHNLIPLLDEGISTGHTSLVVGDAKQAIYRFREGDVEQFIKLPEVEGSSHGDNFTRPDVAQHLQLSTNYRTGETIVNFNNRFFEWLIKNKYANNKLLQDTYIGNGESISLHQTAHKTGGFVRVGFWDSEEEDALGNQILNIIQHQVVDLGYHYKDILIIGRTSKILNQIATFLNKQTINGESIPMVSNEAFLLSNSKVAQIVRCVMGYLVDMQNRVCVMQLMRHLKNLGIIENDHAMEFVSRDAIDLTQLLNNEGLSINCEELLSMTLYDCCEEIIRNLKLSAFDKDYTTTLLNQVAKYSKLHRQDMAEFIEWYDKNLSKFSAQTAEDLNAIQLMTIHKSKGLEAPIVILPIFPESNHRKSIWVDIDDNSLQIKTSLISVDKTSTIFDDQKEQEMQLCAMDDVNTYYVALTRPKQKLMLCCQENKKEAENYISHLKSFAEEDHQHGYCQYDEESNCYCYGEDQECDVAEEKESNIKVTLSNISYPRWDDRIAIADQSEKLFNPMSQAQIRWGNQVHDVLATINHHQNYEQAIAFYAQKNKLAQDDVEKITAIIEHLINHPTCKKFFDPQYKIMNECNLMFRGEILRPDKIIFAEKEVWIVDFKTGSENAKHKEQVSGYCNAITEMGYTNVKGYLLYLNTNNIDIVEV